MDLRWQGCLCCDSEAEWFLTLLDADFPEEKRFGAPVSAFCWRRKFPGLNILAHVCDGIDLMAMLLRRISKRVCDDGSRSKYWKAWVVYAPMPGYDEIREEIEQNVVEAVARELLEIWKAWSKVLSCGIIIGVRSG